MLLPKTSSLPLLGVCLLLPLLLGGCPRDPRVERADRAVRRGDTELAIRLYEEAAGENDSRRLRRKLRHARIEHHISRGRKRLASGKPQEAQAAFEEALALSPDHSEALTGRREAIEARVRRRLAAAKRFEEQEDPWNALLEYQKVQELIPKHPEAAAGVLRSDTLRKKREEEADACYNRARAHIVASEWEEALEELKTCLALFPEHELGKKEIEIVRRELAEALEMRGKREEKEEPKQSE